MKKFRAGVQYGYMIDLPLVSGKQMPSYVRKTLDAVVRAHSRSARLQITKRSYHWLPYIKGVTDKSDPRGIVAWAGVKYFAIPKPKES